MHLPDLGQAPLETLARCYPAEWSQGCLERSQEQGKADGDSSVLLEDLTLAEDPGEATVLQ